MHLIKTMAQVHRFYLEGLLKEGILSFPEEQHRIASKVLRLETGDSIEILNGEGVIGHARLQMDHPKITNAEIYSIEHQKQTR